MIKIRKQKIVGVCAGCGRTIFEKPDTICTGYARLPNKAILCGVCCDKRDIEWMRARGHIVLYLTDSGRSVTNWHGGLKFHVRKHKTRRHNFVSKRHDVWFLDADGNEWWGVNYGDDTQICHCKRLKEKT